MDLRLLTAGVAAFLCVAALVVLGVVLTAAPAPVAQDHRSPVLIARSDPPPGLPPSVTVPDTLLPAQKTSPLISPEPSKPPRVAALPPAAELAQPPADVPSAEAPKAPVAPAPRQRPPVDHRYDGVMTTAEIGRLRRALRLSSDQEPYWPRIASILREVGRRQTAQVDAGQKPTFDLPEDLSSQLYSAVTPLMGTLRDDQKNEIKRRAKSLGLESVASYL